MFTSIDLENFKSFNTITLDLTAAKNKPKNLLAIYGENGSGKSSLIEAVGILRLSIETVHSTNQLNKITAMLEEKDTELISIDEQFDLSAYFKLNKFANMKEIIKNTKTIDSEKEMKLTFSFLLNGEDRGIYRLVFDHSDTLVCEQLDYTINERRGNLFTISKESTNDISIELNKKIFLTADMRNELVNRTQKLWGKHSLLSIFNAMTRELNASYIEKNVSSRFFEVMNFFSNISVASEEYSALSKVNCLLLDFINGKVELDEEYKIDKTQEVLDQFFSSLYVDIKDVFYKKRRVENKIRYELYLKKNIYGKLIDIPFKLESKGTKQLLNILPYFLNVADGGVCFVDEIDNGIHDILVNHLLDNLADDIKGQLVFSTHDTLMLKELPKQSVYFITIDYDGNKKVKNLNDYENQTISKNNNLQNQYLKGAFEGIPIPMDIDFEEIVQTFRSDADE